MSCEKKKGEEGEEKWVAFYASFALNSLSVTVRLFFFFEKKDLLFFFSTAMGPLSFKRTFFRRLNGWLLRHK